MVEEHKMMRKVEGKRRVGFRFAAIQPNCRTPWLNVFE